MSDEPQKDADPAVKPQVIDLDAVEVSGDEPKPAEPETPPRSMPRRQGNRSFKVGVAVAALLGVIAGGWLYRDALATYFPSNAMTAMANRIGAIEVSNKTLLDQVQSATAAADAASQRAAGLEQATKDAGTAATAATAAAAALDQRIAGLEQSVKAAQGDIAKLRAGLSVAPSAGGGDPAALAAVSQRLDALEKDVAALKAGGGAAGNAEMVTALRQALSDLQAKIAAGTAYRGDLDRVLKFVPAASNDLLASYADKGLPNAQGLADQLRSLAKDLPKPAAPATDQGYLSSFWNAVTSVVTIRDVGDADWQALSEAAAKLADQNKLQDAVAGLDAAQAALPDALSRWRDLAVARIKLEAASSDLAKAVELTLAAKGAGQ